MFPDYKLFRDSFGSIDEALHEIDFNCSNFINYNSYYEDNYEYDYYEYDEYKLYENNCSDVIIDYCDKDVNCSGFSYGNEIDHLFSGQEGIKELVE